MTASPDARLLDVCDMVLDAQARMDALEALDMTPAGEASRLTAGWWTALRLAQDIRPVTVRGLQAKAALVRLLHASAGDDSPAGVFAPALAGDVQAVTSGEADADLIARCRRFAEADLEAWYRYVLHPPAPGELGPEPDHEAVRWITATPATTPAGWQAKALALTAWSRGAFDDEPDERTAATTLLAGLLRDMVARERAAIIAGLRERYGPLPPEYSEDGVWLGPEIATAGE